MASDPEARIASRDNPLADVLRNAKIIASGLKDAQDVEWMDHELLGYPNGEMVPPYRRIQGSLKWLNPVRGLCPFGIANREIEREFETIVVCEGVSTLESHIADAGANGILQYELGAKALNLIQSWMNPEDRATIKPFRVASRGSIQGVLDATRNRVLDWYIQLRKKGVEIPVPTDSPLKNTSSTQNINIQHMTGIVGSASANSIVISNFSTIQGALTQAGIGDGAQLALRNLMTEFTLASSPEAKKSIARKAGLWVGEHAVELGSLAVSILQFFGIGAS